MSPGRGNQYASGHNPRKPTPVSDDALLFIGTKVLWSMIIDNSNSDWLPLSSALLRWLRNSTAVILLVLAKTLVFLAERTAPWIRG
jgi:hypothetical protein